MCNWVQVFLISLVEAGKTSQLIYKTGGLAPNPGVRGWGGGGWGVGKRTNTTWMLDVCIGPGARHWSVTKYSHEALKISKGRSLI